MELQNINKQYIKVISSHINAGDIELVKVDVNYNCCPNIYSDTLVYMSPRKWEAELISGNINEIIGINVTTGLSFNLLSASHTINAFDSDSVKSLMDDFRTNLKTTIGSFVDTEYDSSTRKITVTGLPSLIALDKLSIDINNVSLFYSDTSKKGNFFSGSDLYLTNEMFEFDELKDGIYKVTMSYYNDSGTEVFSETNCIFFDNQVQCLLAEYLNKIVKDKSDTDLHMIHYALTQGTNCKCNCDDMCKLFEYLWKKLVTQIPSRDCGCNK